MGCAFNSTYFCRGLNLFNWGVVFNSTHFCRWPNLFNWGGVGKDIKQGAYFLEICCLWYICSLPWYDRNMRYCHHWLQQFNASLTQDFVDRSDASVLCQHVWQCFWNNPLLTTVQNVQNVQQKRGWYTTVNCNVKCDQSTVAPSSLPLYSAHWLRVHCSAGCS